MMTLDELNDLIEEKALLAADEVEHRLATEIANLNARIAQLEAAIPPSPGDQHHVQ